MANGEDLNIPVSAIFTFESLKPGKAPDSPETAESFIRYDYGLGPMQVALNTTFDVLNRQIQKHRAAEFIKLVMEDATTLYLPKEGVRGLVGIPEGETPDSEARCAVACQIGGVVINFRVQETVAQIRILMGDKPPRTPIKPKPDPVPPTKRRRTAGK
jgi:hypothetical protein